MKPKNQIIWWILFLILIGAFLVYAGRGFWMLAVSEKEPIDLFLRWKEIRHVFQGVNPYDLSESAWQQEHQSPAIPPGADLPPGATSVASGYPPWAFGIGALFIPPTDFWSARLWFVFLNLGALFLLARFAWSQSSGLSLPVRAAFVATMLCPRSLGITLQNGQWGILLNAVTVAFLAGRSQAPFPGGFAFAILCLKPTFSFSLVPWLLFRRPLRDALLAAALLLAATAMTTFLTGTYPWTMLGQMLAQTTRWQDASYSIPDAITKWGCPRQTANIGCLVAGMLLAGCVVKKVGPMLYCLAICTTIGRLFAYHQIYDNILVSFLGLALLHYFLNHKKQTAFLLYLLILAGLLIPGTLVRFPWVQTGQLLSWSAGAVYLYYCSPKPPSTPTPSTPSPTDR